MLGGSRGWRLATLTAGLSGLYFAQGLVSGTTETWVGAMAQRGVELEAQAGLLAWAALPWLLKVGWAVGWDLLAPPGSRRREPLLFVLQLGLAAAFVGLGGSTSSGHLPLVFFALNLVASMQDVGTDAYAVDAIPEGRRGLVNACMAAARSVGANVIGAGVLVAWWTADGNEGAGARTATICAVLGLSALVLRASVGDRSHAEHGALPASETPSLPTPAPRLARLRALSALVSTPRARMALVLALLVLAGDGLSSAVSADFLFKRAGWTLEAYVQQLRPLAGACGLLGFALAAVLVDRVASLRALSLGALALGASWALMALAPSLWTRPETIFALAVVEGFAQSLVLVAAYAFLMGVAAPSVRATHFVIYMALLNLPRLAGPLLAPEIFGLGGYAGVWAAAAALELLLFVLAWWGWRRGWSAASHE